MTHTISLRENLVRNKFNALKLYFLIGLCLTGFFLLTDEVLAIDTIEDFDSYPVNTFLDIGTGDWLDVSNPLKVLDSRFYSSPHSAYLNWGLGFRASGLDVSASNSQNMGFNIYVEECPIGSPFFISFNEDSNYIGSFQSVEIVDDECEIKGMKSGGYETLGSVPFDTWLTWVFQQSEIESLPYVRYSLNGGFDYSDWLPMYSGVVRDIETFWIQSNANNELWVDNITTGLPVCEIGSCNLCEVYGTCVEAGCNWFYSIYLQQSYCVEPYETDPEECGSFFKCPFCLTQTPCELELGCEWVDRGLGDKCYMTEATIPPIQEEWEVPDLEDCGALSGVEKWLCEIKNDFLGVFMPSQAKVSALYQTIGAFKEKFPFNYVDSMKVFFTDISDSIDEEKPIPIKILGQEANVSFEFWEEETTIGGVGETFKNVLFDFTTIVVLVGFFVWLVSLIKRFF